LVAAEFDRALDLWCVTFGDSESARVRYVVRLLQQRGAWRELVREWAAADRHGDADAAWRMGWVLLEQGDQAGCTRALERAAERGNLAMLSWQLRKRRLAGQDITEIGKRYRQADARQQRADELADQRGDADAAYRIGNRLVAQWSVFEQERYPIRGRTTSGSAIPTEEFEQAKQFRREGEEALRRAVERGSADAATKLGRLADRPGEDKNLHTREERDEALNWYRRADELGHPEGSRELGSILRELGDTAGAEAAYRRAAEIGHDEWAWRHLALFLQKRGDLRCAEGAHHKAIEHNAGRAKLAPRFFNEDHPALKPTDAT
jgi:tetratricopeptide (TPR) repeat protein